MPILPPFSRGIARPKTPGLATVACGQWHTVAITDSGDLYTWGWGRFGQLAQACSDEVFYDHEDIVQMTPRLVPGVENVCAVAAGVRHTAIVVAAASTSTRFSGVALGTLRIFGDIGIDLHCAEDDEVAEATNRAIPIENSTEYCAMGSGPWGLAWGSVSVADSSA